VLAILAAGVILAVGFASYVFQRYLRYQPHVQDHVPADYAVALRLDVEPKASYEPFRQHLLPLLDADRASRPGLPPRLATLRSATTIELDVHLREIGVVVDRRGRWLVLLGGHFRQSGVVRGIAELLLREGAEVRIESRPERLVHASGAALGVGSDGVIVLAATDELLVEVLEPRKRSVRFPAGTALSLAVGSDGDAALSGLRVDVWPGQDFAAELRLPDAGASGPAPIERLLSRKTGDFKLLSGTGAWHVERAPEGFWRASAVLSPAEFDGAVAELARSLRTLLGLPLSE
jgi:hypothetical protein